MSVYLIRCGENGPVKIGKTDNPTKRLYELQVAHWERLKLLRVWEGGEPEESALHLRFADLAIAGDWFAFSRAMLGDVGLAEIISEPDPLPIWRPLPVIRNAMIGDIGNTLRRLRRERDLTQAEVALGSGIARSSIASIEAGHDLPGRASLLMLARFFDVSIDALCAPPGVS